MSHSKEFFDFIRGIGESKSKQEEDKIVVKEIATLKTHFATPKLQLRSIKEYIIRALYCEMLGHEASFAYINAIQLAASKNLLEKRTGYMAHGLFVPNTHELNLLMVATIQKDLQSTNYLQICYGLNAALQVASQETIPAIVPMLQKLKAHKMPIVRKKVYSLYQRFFALSHDDVPNIIDIAKEGLCDPDPSVMGTVLHIFLEVLQEEAFVALLRPFTNSFISVLRQIVEHHLPRDYDYHNLPAPWIQMHLLRILAFVGKDDKKTSEQMYEILSEVLQRGDTGLHIGHAVVFEAIRTITTIFPNNTLLETAASATARLLSSQKNNYKYVGIKALTTLIQISPEYANPHQMAVIDCLENFDDSIKTQTLELLLGMCSAKNVDVIVKKLVQYAAKTIDENIRSNLVEKITGLAEKFAPNPTWFIDTMCELFQISPHSVSESAVQSLMNVIAVGTGEDEEGDDSEETDKKMRQYAVDKFFDICNNNPSIDEKQLRMMAWILGEYGFLSQQNSLEDIIETLCLLIDRPIEQTETRPWLVASLMKVVALYMSSNDSGENADELPGSVDSILQKYRKARDVALQQRCEEFLALIASLEHHKLETVLPKDGSCEEIEVDEELTFLDDFVNEAEEAGAWSYVEEDKRAEFFSKFMQNDVNADKQGAGLYEHIPGLTSPADIDQSTKGKLKTEKYEDPQVPAMLRKVAASVQWNEDSSTVDLSKDGQALYPSKAGEEPSSTEEILNSHKKNKVWFEDDSEGEQDDEKEYAAQDNGESSPVPPSSSNKGESPSFESMPQKKFNRIGASSDFSAADDENVAFSPPKRNPEDDKPKLSKKKKEFMAGIFGGDEPEAKSVASKPRAEEAPKKKTVKKVKKEEEPEPEPEPEPEEEPSNSTGTLLSLDD